ncbi:LuxR family transcriptional regulator [Streptomyces graminofaciens]|uniref:LuxR family transcriptional regulator n=1 Tax=Streptomyces graminofaciens TaxID=68212 RepID=A0ABM8HLR6_9ACTN|nr:response regulator transcription factor [Streptomyces graminofaciens]BBC35504.1 LuxR family transcriptional regulator [Streptomyces graminofaciens]
MERVAVFVHAEDQISRSGVVSQLRQRPELWVLQESEQERAAVVFVVTDSVDDHTAVLLRRLGRTSAARVVLIASRVDDSGLITAAECGVLGVVRRSEATPDRIVQVALLAARGESSMPSDLLARLLAQVGKMHQQLLDPRGLSYSGMSTREIGVLKLVADGLDTREIAESLSYSERTVKNILHDVTSRLQLRNRTHAVAYALRQGLI